VLVESITMSNDINGEAVDNISIASKPNKNALWVALVLVLAAFGGILALAGSGAVKLPPRLDGLIGYVSGYIAGKGYVHPCKFDFRSRTPEYRAGVFQGHADSRKP
jgi:hypothetical protein